MPVKGSELLIAQVDALARGDAVVRAKLETIVGLLVRLIPACDTASVGIVVRGGATTAATFDHVALEVDLLQYQFEEGPCLDAAGLAGGGSHVVRIDLMEDACYQRFAPGALDAGVTSSLSLPCRSDIGAILGSINMYSRGSGAFGAASEQTAAPFVAAVADIIAGSLVYDAALDLVADVTMTAEASATINQAVGMIMQNRGCSAEAAIALLTTIGMARGEDLKSAADAIVDGRPLLDGD